MMTQQKYQFISPALTQRYEQVADAIEAEIRAGTYQPGDRLPGERDLAQRLGVGRTTVREALGALQVGGFVETRQGAGSFVVDRPPAITLLDIPADASPSSLLDARLVLEPTIASLAAEVRGDSDEIQRLLDVMESSCDPTDPAERAIWSDADRAFHRCFAFATGNGVLTAFADHISELMDQPLWRRMRDDSIAAPGRTTLHLAEHRLIAAAVAEGDAEAAARYAREHINRVRRYMTLAG